jgi:hypothetical protein
LFDDVFVERRSPAMNDRRFLAILNDVAGEMGPQLFDPGAGPGDARAVATWARFLHACVARGVMVGDRRWHALELRSVAGRPRFALPESGGDAQPDSAGDFSVGLALLMAMLGREDESD